MGLLKKLKKWPLKQKILAGLVGLVFLSGIGIFIWGIVTGEIVPKAAVVQISNTASVTYQDSTGTSYTSQSNTVLVDVSTPLTAINISYTLQGKMSLEASGVILQIYLPGSTTAIVEKTDIATSSDGKAAVTLENIAVGNYDVKIKVPNFLSKKKTNIALSEGVTIDFSQLLAGDLNNDDQIYLPDYSILAGAWRTKTGEANFNSIADLNNDGQIYLPDYSILISNWRKKGD